MSIKETSKYWFGLAAGMIYILFGVLQVVYSMMDWDHVLFPPDIIGGLVLIIIGLVFLTGAKELSKGIHEGVAYIYVGIFLGVIFGLIFLMMMGANAVEAYAFDNEDFIRWTPIDDAGPQLYLSLIPFIGMIRWRSKFSVKKLSRAGV